MIKGKFLLIVLVIFCVGVAKAQIEISVNIESEQDTIIIGDQVVLRVSVTSPKEDNIAFPEFDKKLAEGIELVEAKAVDTLKSKDKNRKHLERKYVITSFDEGNYHLNGFPVFKITPSGVDTIYCDQEIALSVKTVEIAEDFQPYDIKDVKTYPSKWWLWTLIIVAAALLITGLVIFLVKKYRKPTGVKKLKIDPYVWATHELDSLKTSNLATTRTKEYYSRLTDIVREYIELQTDISVMEKTSDEILSVLPDTIFNSTALIAEIRELFGIADLVKFAKYPASIYECEMSWDDAHQFVTESNIITNELKQTEHEDSGNTGNTAI